MEQSLVLEQPSSCRADTGPGSPGPIAISRHAVMVWQNNHWISAAARSDPERFIWHAIPIFPAAEPWHDMDTIVDPFWGPSAHWNTYLQQHVMLLNRSKDTNWTQDGHLRLVREAARRPAPVVDRDENRERRRVVSAPLARSRGSSSTEPRGA